MSESEFDVDVSLRLLRLSFHCTLLRSYDRNLAEPYDHRSSPFFGNPIIYSPEPFSAERENEQQVRRTIGDQYFVTHQENEHPDGRSTVCCSYSAPFLFRRQRTNGQLRTGSCEESNLPYLEYYIRKTIWPCSPRAATRVRANRNGEQGRRRRRQRFTATVSRLALVHIIT